MSGIGSSCKTNEIKVENELFIGSAAIAWRVNKVLPENIDKDGWSEKKMITNVQFNFSHEPGLHWPISAMSGAEWFINVPILSTILSFASWILSLVTKEIMKLNYDYQVLSLYLQSWFLI